MIKLNTKNKHALRRNIACGILLAFFVNMVLAPISPAFAQGAGVPALGNFQPPVLLGLKIHPENPLLFDFIVDQGQSKLSNDELKSETTKLVKYFLAALTIPDKEVWVNLSPTEKDRIIPDVLGQTTMGKTMLEQDYVLKQLAASLTNPETDLGKKYWDQVNGVRTLDAGRLTLEKNSTTSVQPPTSSDFNKVWIMPAKAEVLESNGIVLVGEKRLKVMMAEDLTPPNPLFKKEGESRNALATPSSDKKSTLLTFSLDKEGESGVTPSSNKENFLVTHSLDKEGEGGVLKSNLSSEIFRTTILPIIEKAVNEGKDFADVRQIYNSVILAAWYKKSLKESLLGKIYTDKGKVAGVETDDKQMKQRIYEQYLAAFKKGAYNLIKEEADESGELIPRKYFSGGIEMLGNTVNVLNRRAASPLQVNQTLSASSTVSSATVRLAESSQREIVSSIVQAEKSRVIYNSRPYLVSEIVPLLTELLSYWENPENIQAPAASAYVHGTKRKVSIQLLPVPDNSIAFNARRRKAVKLENLIKALRMNNKERLAGIRFLNISVLDNYQLNIFMPSNLSVTAEDIFSIFKEKLLPLIRSELEKYSLDAKQPEDYWASASKKTSFLLAGHQDKIATALDANFHKFDGNGNFYDLKATLSDPSRVRLQEIFSKIQNIIAEVLGDAESFESQKATLLGHQIYIQTEKAAYVNESLIQVALASDILSNWKKNVRFRERLAPEISKFEKPLVQVTGVLLRPDLIIDFILLEDDLGVVKTVKETAVQVAKEDRNTPTFLSDTLAATIAYLYGKNISRKQLLALNQRLSEINDQLQQYPITFFIDEIQLQAVTKKGFVVTASKTLKLSASSSVNKQNSDAPTLVGGLDSQVGGIDFDPTNMNLQIKRDGRGVPLPLPEQNLEQINVQGLFPVIINITPINAETLPIFLGQAPKEPAKEIEQVSGTSNS